MQTRAVRLAILALLVVIGLGAAFVTWNAHIRLRDGLAREREVERRLDRMSEAIAGLGAAQQAYVAPGQQRGDALTRASILVQQIYDDIAGLRAAARSTDAAPSLLAFGQAMDILVNVDDRAREHLRAEENLLAADLIYTEARQAIDAMNVRLAAIDSSEERLGDDERRELVMHAGSVAGGAALIWLAGVLALARAPRSRDRSPMEESRTELQVAANPPAGAGLDLSAAAAVCVELSRLGSAEALAPALRRAARVLDATGLIVWLGAGEELFPASAYGYGPATLARLGPIRRTDANATAVAWRTAETGVVPGDPDRTNGALVAPLVAHGNCFGVLSAELRHGRENDETMRAVATIIAAQLSTVVAPWPAPSQAEGDTASSQSSANAIDRIGPEQTAASA